MSVSWLHSQKFFEMLYDLAVGPEAVMLWDIETGTR